MKPQARPFTVEIKRTKRPVHSSPFLTTTSLRPGDRSLRKLGASDRPPDGTTREAAFKGALSEADRVFGRSMTPVPVAAPVVNGIPQNADPQLRDRADVAAATPTHDAERSGSEKPRQGRILPDLLSAAREEEQARAAHTISGARRVLRRTGTPALPEPAQSEAIQPEATVGSDRPRKARAGVKSLRNAVPGPPEMVVAGEQGPTVVPSVHPPPGAAKPSGAGRGNDDGRLRRRVRVGEAIPLRAGERWKRRLPPVCR